MDRIALIYENTFLYWSSVLLALGGVVAVCTFLALYLREEGNGTAGAVCVPLAMTLSLALARLVHWYCRTSSYASLAAAMTDYTYGDYALMGVFAGCALAALILRITGISRNLPRTLDCMSLAGCAGIAVGRLASFFDASDRGMLMAGGKLPWVYPVVNPVSGVEEYRLATFLIQAMVAAVIFLPLLVFYLRGSAKGSLKDGDTCVIFLLCYGASQVLLDSTRYDSLYFRSNGFVSIVQVLGALAIGLAAIVFSVRLVKNRGWKKRYLGLWLALAGLLGLAGYMEYHVQRHASEAAFAYSVMGACLVGLVALCLVIRMLAGTKEGYILKKDILPEEV